MKKLKDFSFSVLLFILVFLFVNLVLYGLPGETQRERSFILKNKSYFVRATAEYCPRAMASDILVVAGEAGLQPVDEAKAKNISRGITGYNIYPNVTAFADRYAVTWINHRRGEEQLYYYDSFLDETRVLVAGGFKFISSAVEYVTDSSCGVPGGMFFIANNSGNDDIFFYSLVTGELKNITQTVRGEKKFRVAQTLGKPYILVETETLYHKYLYRFRPDDLDVKLIYKDKIPRHVIQPPKTWTKEALNTFLAFGDSITWGKMRMNNLPIDPTKQYHHPELAYPQKVLELLQQDYAGVYHISDGFPGGDTYSRSSEIDGILAIHDAKYFLLMLGTNDAFRNWETQTAYSLDGCLENLAYIIDAALAKGMYAVISTIPPRNDNYDTELVRSQINDLNAGIIELAGQKGIRYIDTFSAFMNYNPPDGWKALLEDRGSSDIYVPGKGGQHPSPLGHDIIAELFAGQLLAFPPATPVNITATKPQTNYITIQWPQQNNEFDFSHYQVEFGYFPGDMNQIMTTATTSFTFIRPPFLNSIQPQVYARVRAVDTNGNMSEPSPTLTIAFD